MPKLHRENGLLPMFAELHAEERGDRLGVEVTFAIDPSIEKLAAAFYMDGSDSMRQAGNYGRGGGLFGFNFGKQRNPVQDAMHIMVPYMTQKDADGVCRVAYWATGKQGKDLEVIGELSAEVAATSEFRGPETFGGGTYLLPAVRDFVAYIQELRQKSDVRAAIAAIVTDGQLHDFDDLIAYTQDLARAIMKNDFPRTNIVLVGVGSEIDEEQLEQLEEATPAEYTGRDIWCHAEAETVDDLPELVAHLLDANIPAFWGGALLKDEQGKIVQAWEDMVPAVIEFELPATARSFTLQVGSERYTQSLEGLGEH